MPAGSGRPAVRPSCTCGPADSTPLTEKFRRLGSARPPSRRAATGWSVSSPPADDDLTPTTAQRRRPVGGCQPSRVSLDLAPTGSTVRFSQGVTGVLQQRKTFRAIEVGDGGDGRWAAYARGLWPEMEGLLTEEGRTPEGADRVGALFRAHMPELVPVLDRLAGQLDRPEAEVFLTHAALRPFSQACTQIGRDGTLLRNYDLRPDQCEGTIASSCYLRPVIGMQDILWGLLDGMNDAGLAVSLTWGGRSVHGRGFAILILVRYLLE